jgi:hypothetical protein
MTRKEYETINHRQLIATYIGITAAALTTTATLLHFPGWLTLPLFGLILAALLAWGLLEVYRVALR